jgi:hypothetical protein
MSEEYSFVQTDHAHYTIYNEDTGILFRMEDGNLFGATPPGGPLAAHAEDWKILHMTTPDRRTAVGNSLEYECEGLIDAALKALKDK